MKYQLLLLSIGFSVQLAAQIPNASFEVWDLYNTWTLEPQYWTTSNDQLMTPVVPDSNAYDGELAMRVNVLPGFEGGVQQSASVLFPTAVVPASLDFYVKCDIPDIVEMDRVSVKISVLNEDAIVTEGEWISYDSIPEWQFVSIQLDDPGMDVTEIMIFVTAGFSNGLFGGSWETGISVDAMSLSSVNNVDEVNCVPLVFPNPTSDGKFNVTGCDFSQQNSIVVNDLSGRLIIACDHCLTRDLELSEKGLYIVSIENSKGIISRQPLLVTGD